MSDAIHVVGDCCTHWKCIWCGNRKHVQAILNADGVATGVAEACESCNYDEFTHESI